MVLSLLTFNVMLLDEVFSLHVISTEAKCSESSPNFVCFQIKVGLTEQLYHYIQLLWKSYN